jgi:hypothetical protein
MIPSEEIITGQNLAAKCDYVFAQMQDTGSGAAPVFAKNAPELKGGEVVFCKTDYIVALFDVVKQCVPLNTPFSILTHDSDYPITTEIVRLFSERPVKFYGMNMCTELGNPVPIGIANSYCGITMKGKDFEKSNSPSRLLYVNHRVENYPQERAWLYPHFSDMSWCTVSDPYPKGELEKYKAELLDHKFILCPRGNGVDTHRMWEALYCGVIPVVKRHRTHRMLEGNLPVLFVNDYKEVTEDLLTSIYGEFSTKSWNLDMLTTSWWIHQMKGLSNAN